MNTRPYILCPADDLKLIVCAHIHFADTELVSIGVGIAGHNLSHNHSLGQKREIVHLLHLKASHRQAFSQLISGFVHLHQILQPGERNPHRELEVSA